MSDIVLFSGLNNNKAMHGKSPHFASGPLLKKIFLAAINLFYVFIWHDLVQIRMVKNDEF